MKYNLTRVNLHNKPDMFGKWWRWEAVCDRCGSLIDRHNVLENREPKFSEIDLCYTCMQFFIRNNIEYKDVREYIKMEKEKK